MATTSPASFYVTGGTLRQDAPSYVERQADKDLYEGLFRGEFCYVLTSRQMGKSSLMVHTAGRLREAGVAVAVLDLTAVGQNLSAEQWYGGLLRRLGLQLDRTGKLEEELDDFWFDQQARMGPLERWMMALQRMVLPRVSERIVVFIDEIDALRSLPFSTDEFFAAIRECYNRRSQDSAFERLTFCLLGVASPSDLIQDTRTTPFNIGRRIELTDFTPAEAAPLAAGLGVQAFRRSGVQEPTDATDPSDPEHLNARTPERLLARILFWTGGHPYLTQRLCQAVAGDPAVTAAAGVDRLCEALFLSPSAREKDDNLLFVRERLLRQAGPSGPEADLASLLDLYGKVRAGKRVGADDTNPLIDLLRLAGVARLAGSRLVVRNRIYERVFDRAWVTAHMPDAERRRQQAAYRRGLLRASAIAGLVLVAVSALSFMAASQAARARRGWQKARRETRRANSQAEQARGLAGRLAVALREKGQTLQQLQGSLAAVKLQTRRASDAADRALRAQHRERDQRLQADAARQSAEQARGDAVQQRGRAVEETRQARRNLYFADMNLAQQDWQTHNIGRLRQLLAATRDQPERGFEWAYWDRLCHLELLSLLGHTDAVRAVAFSPDGRRIATGSDDGTTKIWDAATGGVLHTLTDQTAPLWCVAFSPDGRRLVTGSGRRAALWDVATGRKLLTLKGGTRIVSAAAFSPDGRRVITGSMSGFVGPGGLAQVWDAATGREALTFRTNDILSIVCSPDGRSILTSGGGTTAVWDARTGHETLRFSVLGIDAASISLDARRVAASDDHDTVSIFDTATGRRLLTLAGLSSRVWAIAFSPDGTRLATGGDDHSVRIWDAATGQELRALWGHTDPVWSIRFSPDGRRLLTGSGDGTAKVWDAATERESRALLNQKSAVRSLAFSPDGRRIVTAQRADYHARVWNAETGAPLQLLRGHQAPVTVVAFSPDGRRIATGSIDHTVRLWDSATGQSRVAFQGHQGWISALAFSPDGQRLLSGSYDGTARLWDARLPGHSQSGTGRGHEILRLQDGEGRGILSVAFSPDGRRLITGSDDTTAKVWDAASGRQLFTLRGHSGEVWSVAFSPDGRRIVTGSGDQTARLWDAASGRLLHTLHGHSGACRSVAFSPDGQRIITGSSDGAVKVWEAGSGREVLSLPGHNGPIDAVAFSPAASPPARRPASGGPPASDASLSARDAEGTRPPASDASLIARDAEGTWMRIAAASEDGTVRLWAAPPQTQIAAWAAAEQAADARLTAARARAAERERDRAARRALAVVATGADGAVRLQWRPFPQAVGYQLYRGSGVFRSPYSVAGKGRGVLASAGYEIRNTKYAPRLNAWMRLTSRPLAGTSFIDRTAVPGRPILYAIEPIVKGAAGRPIEERSVTLQAAPLSLPPGWAGSSINEERSGSARFDPATGEITLWGSGEGVGGTGDECYFLNRPLTGDFQISASLRAGPTDTYPWARAGLMLREASDAGARTAYLSETAANGLLWMWRSTTGGQAADRPGIGTAEPRRPVTLRLIRRGDTVRAEFSLDDGRSFQPAGDPVSFKPALARTVFVGLAATALDPGQLCQATFGRLTIRKP